MTWRRAPFASALAAMLEAAAPSWPWDGPPPTIFAGLPETCNPPAIVVGWPTEVLYAVRAFTIDEATVPVVCVGPLPGGEGVIDNLIAFVVATQGNDPTIGHTVQVSDTPSQRNWRATRIGGADVTAADLVLTVQM